MAQIHTALAGDRPPLGTHIGSIFVGLMDARSRALRIEERGTEMRRLMALDDAALGRMGLSRDQVPRHVFRDLLIF